jgi:hypothetical protein
LFALAEAPGTLTTLDLALDETLTALDLGSGREKVVTAVAKSAARVAEVELESSLVDEPSKAPAGKKRDVAVAPDPQVALFGGGAVLSVAAAIAATQKKDGVEVGSEATGDDAAKAAIGTEVEVDGGAGVGEVLPAAGARGARLNAGSAPPQKASKRCPQASRWVWQERCYQDDGQRCHNAPRRLTSSGGHGLHRDDTAAPAAPELH